MILQTQELLEIKGGSFNVGNWIINSLNFINEVGRSIGSAISYLIHGLKC